jgi:dihydroorotase
MAKHRRKCWICIMQEPLLFPMCHIGIKDSGVLLRALQYVQPFNGLIITMPFDKTLVGDGQVNESEISVRMGMKGITNLSEYSVVQRDIELLKYTGGKLHFVGISTKESIELIEKQKQKI